MPGSHRSWASWPGGRNVFIVFHLNSLFILLTVLTAYREGEWDIEREGPFTLSSLIMGSTLFLSTYVFKGILYVTDATQTINLPKEIKHFSCNIVSYKTQREGVGKRANRGFIAMHPNISRRCVTEYAGPIYVSEHQCIPLTDSSAQPGIQRVSHTWRRQPHCFRNHSHLLIQIIWLDYTPK